MARVIDLFCGAGGTTLGAESAGCEVVMAVNHWPLAIQTHNLNFPNTDHDCVDISQCNPRRYPKTDILTASPECTNHSIAKGVRRRNQQKGLFDDPNPEAVRSRATMADVVVFAEHHDYKVVVVENVVDVCRWIYWEDWLADMVKLGYQYRVLSFNSQFAPPTPQSRDRVYIVFWKGIRKPDLEFRPVALCPKCGIKESYQAFKNGRTYGKYGPQYVYLCTGCHTKVTPGYTPAYSAIDWKLPIRKIGERKIPLREKTLERIRVGLRKYVEPFVLGHGLDASYKSVSEPFQVIVAGGNHHFLVTTSHSHAADSGKVKPMGGPLPTLTTCQDQGFVVAPLIVANYTPGWSRPVSGPLGSITTDDHHSLVIPPGFQLCYRSDGQGQPVVESLSEPTSTITAHAAQHYLCSYYSGSDQVTGMYETIPTITGNDRHALIKGEIDVNECGFRMLSVPELQAGMAFPASYQVLGTQKEKVRQLGNAVTPPVMQQILSRCVASLA